MNGKTRWGAVLLKQRTEVVWFAFLVLAGISLLIVCMYIPGVQKLVDDWSNALQTILLVLTLLVSAYVWRNEAKQDWERDLPKRITIRYIHQETGDVLMRAENFPLTGESDIRAWGQQLGQQMANGELLKFNTFEIAEKAPENDAAGGIWFKPYELTLYLKKIPAKIGLDDPQVFCGKTCVWHNEGKEKVKENWE